ncbi:MFS general substrate transporter [Aspergillus steynii IBT 23096]|uniref:MFS general substrate transporter n=1 Tax=Aspergillus steynii IBT 23096 TaxID=1392250 RepID=A0A2I2FYW4_9EURO|nr:MFS general substrate transporter [Aspergillus steynii IBT 23096]PLB45830.1 MFS general substrate transporter [Aspergillus steynii IBT 23096]
MQGEICTVEEEKRVRRKIDMVILPMLCCVFFFQYLDKQSLSYAGVFGLITDLNLQGSQYSWCSSIFYFGQLVAEYPFIYLMSRLPLTKFVGATIIIWGAICMCLAAPKSFPGFAAVRFLLGFAEGAVSPAFVTITSIWYQKKDHAMRIGLWITMNGLAQVIGCLLMYGIGKNSQLGLAPWRVMFLVCGALTTLSGVLFTVLMPNGPQDAWFLTPREKEVLRMRMTADNEGGDVARFSGAQFKEAMWDGKSWVVFGFGLLVTMQSPVLTFASLVINNIGYDKFDTLLYTAPSGAVQVAFIWIAVIACLIFPRRRSLIVMVLALPPLVGNVLLLKLPLSAQWGLIVASWLSSCISDVMTILLSLSASNVKGNTKRAVVNTLFFIGYCVGCIASPQLWTKKPRYFEGVVTSMVTWCLLFVVMGVYWGLCVRENKARDEKASRGEVDESTGVEGDVTDKQDRGFRYSY